MKTANLLRLLLCSAILLFCGTACDDEDERLSTIQEMVMEGDANSIEIPMNRNSWIVSSVTFLDGITITNIDLDQPLKLEGMGSARFHWGRLIRDKANALTVELDDNFDNGERGIIINIGTTGGLYNEQITIRQKQCTNFYQIESIVYSLREGDGIREDGTEPWGITWINKSTATEETQKVYLFPFYNVPVEYSFKYEVAESPHQWVNPEGDYNYVDMPVNIVDGEIIFEEEKQKYTTYGVYRNELHEKSFEMEMVPMKRNNYRADVYCKHLQVSYVLTLSRPGNDTKKIISGKLVKRYPYACSPIRHVVSDLLPED